MLLGSVVGANQPPLTRNRLFSICCVPLHFLDPLASLSSTLSLSLPHHFLLLLYFPTKFQLESNHKCHTPLLTFINLLLQFIYHFKYLCTPYINTQFSSIYIKVPKFTIFRLKMLYSLLYQFIY